MSPNYSQLHDIVYMLYDTAASADCNRRGQHHGNASDACVCDAPYAGDECQHCASGFYAVPM